MIEYLFPCDCYNEIIKRKNFFHRKCLSILSLRLLGPVITIVSSFYLVPQILKIYLAKSGEGISLFAKLLGLVAVAAYAAYGYGMGIVFGQWGDSLIISVQTVVIVLQILWYSNSIAYAAAFLTLSSFAALAVFYHSIPMMALIVLQACSVPFIFASKGVQILKNFNEKGTGQLSLITILMQCGGSLAKTHVILSESGLDWLLLIPCLVTAVLNGLVLSQIIYYSNSEKDRGEASNSDQAEAAQSVEHV